MNLKAIIVTIILTSLITSLIFFVFILPKEKTSPVSLDTTQKIGNITEITSENNENLKLSIDYTNPNSVLMAYFSSTKW